ncbi:unnamed protein product [Closterium sp. Yama58-4]|nr:unnamed protein product [Closterium sp. Yama58-4]
MQISLYLFPSFSKAALASICFLTGAAMEAFMIKTGFYDKVTAIEAQRRIELRERSTDQPKHWSQTLWPSDEQSSSK